ncbi:MAG: hypothetical protein KF749_08055 [Bacteroidetes bacterium]|nr:hypothetical protein [Bacteroidota bacterium]MCW5894906.1 hypothetical protein [Bacteroidota bacterium]
MIIHNMEWVRKLRVVREVKQWLSSGIISTAQYDAIKTAYTTPLYTPTLFIRIVLFVFTCIALLGVYGIIFLAVSPTKDSAFAFFFVVTGVLSFVAMETVVKQRKFYEAGIEEALLYAALGLTIGGVVLLYTDATYAPRPGVVPWIIALPFLMFGAMRYADRLVTAAAYLCALAVLLVPLAEGGPVAKAVLPFVAMAAAALTYVLVQKYGKRKSLEPWKECLFVVELLALVAFYCGGNYFVVREGNEILMGAPIPEGKDIPLAFLFYALTILTPVVYVVRGLMIRDHLLLRTGLLAAVASVLTFRYYYAVVPPETALTIAGAALFVIAALSIRYLKTDRNGFTHRNILKEKLKDVNVEGLLISQTLGPAPQAVKKESGGGEFGGGGATGNW